VDEVFDRPLTQIAHSRSYDSLLLSLNKVKVNGTTQRLQIVAMRKDGTTLDVEVSLASVPHNENHVVCTLFDISQFKAIEQIKDQFISTVNHEIRTPLAAIVLSVDTLQTYYDKLAEEQR